MSKLFIFGLLLFFISCTKREETKSFQKINEGKNHFEYLSTLSLPKELQLFGEQIPLSIPEVRERAEREFYLLLQQPGQIILYIKRSGKYFPLFERILKENGLPDDLKYLSVAESALYMARSAKDAVGLWQFIESTAIAMGLEVNEFVDERRHPEKSTYAAIKYLKSGYSDHKSWLLSAAGYNMGHENIKSSMEKQYVKDFFDLFLNEETSRYILRIALIKHIMTNSKEYGFQIETEEIYQTEKTRIIKVNYNITDLSDWAKLNNISYKDIKLLNPWILKNQLPKSKIGKIYEIYIPK